MFTIPLTRGMVTIVDDADFEALSAFKWYAVPGRSKHSVRWYAIRVVGGRRTRKRLAMHRVILNVADSELVDHINHDGLDNRRVNLRKATYIQNAVHKRWRTPQTGYRGVRKLKSGRFAAELTIDSKRHYLGTFDHAIDAGRAWDAAALAQHGGFAMLNFPMD